MPCLAVQGHMATVPIELIMVEMECSVREPVCHYIQIKLLLGSYPHAGCMLEQVFMGHGALAESELDEG